MQEVNEMFRVFVGAVQRTSRCLLNKPIIFSNATAIKPVQNSIEVKQFSTLLNTISTPILSNPKIQEISKDIIRTVVKFSWRKGKRKSVKNVLCRFYRLQWGGWIRTKAGRHKKLWKKSSARKRRLRQHVFCNATQSTLLDKMVGPYWRKPRYFVDDPYEPYHVREEFKHTYRQPRPYITES